MKDTSADVDDFTGTLTATVDAANHGERADKAVQLLLPGASLRRRRRLFQTHTVRVNGRPIGAGQKVFEDQTLTAEPLEVPTSDVPVQKLVIVKQTPAYAAVLKPAGLHSAAIAGVPGPSVQAMLPTLFPGTSARLLNRLDALTSGLVLVAMNDKAARAFAALDSKLVRKEYLAVVHGELHEELMLRFQLDTDDRKRTRVVPKMLQDPRDFTRVRPIKSLAGGLTLLRVNITEGARHQIRAHLAFAGLPILGDPLYGDAEDGAPRMYLHHTLLDFPGFRADAPVDWPKPETLAQALAADTAVEE